MQTTLSDCVLTRWHLGFNDPYLTSWVMVAIYLLVAGMAVAVVRRGSFPARSARRERVFWGVVASVLVLMAVNKQADLQTLMLATGRCVAQSDGWYEFRQAIKGIAFVAIAIALIGSGTVLFWCLRRTFRRTGLPLLGLFLMFLFVLSRAFWIFHFIPSVEMAHRLYPILVHGWPSRFFEVSGPLVIFVAAVSLLIPHFRAASERNSQAS